MNATTSKIENAAAFEAGALDSGSEALPDPRARIITFATVVTTILLAANWFVFATWNHFWGAPAGVAWQIILSALALIFIATTILGMRHSNPWLRLAYRVSAVWLGVLNFTFFAAGAVW